MISLHKIWIITKSLLLSQLRAAAVRTNSRIGVHSILRRPLILLIIDVVGFVAATAVAYYVGSLIDNSAQQSLVSTISGGVHNIIVILPAVILSIILILGLVLEVSSGAQFTSSDTVNWLPVKASEYVAASTLSLLIYYSIFPVVVLGATLSLAYVFGFLGSWSLRRCFQCSESLRHQASLRLQERCSTGSRLRFTEEVGELQLRCAHFQGSSLSSFFRRCSIPRCTSTFWA